MEDDAEKGGMLWEEANSCMFSLPHCPHQKSQCAGFRRSCYTQACFYTIRIHPHAAACCTVRESVCYAVRVDVCRYRASIKGNSTPVSAQDALDRMYLQSLIKLTSSTSYFSYISGVYISTCLHNHAHVSDCRCVFICRLI